MPLCFLLDEQLRGGSLRKAIDHHNALGIYPLDVVRVGDPPDLPLGTTDPDVLLWAEREGRIVITLDRNTMPGHLANHLQAGRHSPGVLIVRGQAALSAILARLVVIAHAGDPQDCQDRVEFIP
jgi:hypothetical protein